MKKSLTLSNKHFEELKKLDEDGVEYWTARELSKVLEYSEYRFFLSVVEKAKIACKSSKQCVDDHFEDVLEMVKIGSGAERKIKNIKLSRYACYLIVQNADSAKEVVAMGQTYFAVQTRRQELYDSLTDDQKRILIRGEVTDYNKKLFETAQNSGVSHFGKFNDAGYVGLYGMNAKEIQRKKGIGNDKILDRAGATELAANLFRITQTDDKLKKKLNEKGFVGQQNSENTHRMVGGKVRQTIKDIGGTMPEELLSEKHIKEIKKRVEPVSIDEPFGKKPKRVSEKNKS